MPEREKKGGAAAACGSAFGRKRPKGNGGAVPAAPRPLLHSIHTFPLKTYFIQINFAFSPIFVYGLFTTQRAKKSKI